MSGVLLRRMLHGGVCRTCPNVRVPLEGDARTCGADARTPSSGRQQHRRGPVQAAVRDGFAAAVDTVVLARAPPQVAEPLDGNVTRATAYLQVSGLVRATCAVFTGNSSAGHGLGTLQLRRSPRPDSRTGASEPNRLGAVVPMTRELPSSLVDPTPRPAWSMLSVKGPGTPVRFHSGVEEIRSSQQIRAASTTAGSTSRARSISPQAGVTPRSHTYARRDMSCDTCLVVAGFGDVHLG